MLVVVDPEPTHFVDVSDHFDAAVASLSAHDAYLAALGPDYPAPADLLGMILGGPAERRRRALLAHRPARRLTADSLRSARAGPQPPRTAR